MPSIYRANSDRLSVAEAKRLILDAVPREPAADIYASVDSEGNIDFDGPIECRVNERANIHATFIDRDFVDTCKDLEIRPRFKYRPVIADYTGDVTRDDTYTIAHDEFVRLAELFGLLVVIGDAPEPAAAPVVAESATAEPAGPLPLATGDIAFCFAGLRWDEQGWKKPLGDKPKWLQACVVIPARRGVSETRWNPVCIAAALVQAGHAKARSVRAAFQTQPLLKPWLEAWNDYEAEYIEKD